MTRNQAIVIHFVLIIISLLFFQTNEFDLKIQNHFFNFYNHSWLISKNAYWPRFIFYESVKVIYAVFIIAIFFLLIFYRKMKLIMDYQKGLIIVALSTIIIPLVVNILKDITNMPCPSDINLYGGILPHIGLFETYPAYAKPEHNIHCFPAGHASGGFALMSLFFLFKNNRHRFLALSLSILLGWIIGLYKILIGDHFFSHTFISMQLAWIIILLIEKYTYKSMESES